MAVAIRTITRLQDADDINVSLGVGVDEYALCWDNDTTKFVLRAVSGGVSDHGGLTGLSDDDHTGYALLAGRAGGQTLVGGSAASNDLLLNSTTHATKGAVRLATDGSVVAINTSGATQALVQIEGGSGATDDQGERLTGTYSSNTAHPHRVETYHPLAVGNAMSCYDAKSHVSGSAVVDHAVGFQARPDYAGSGTIGAVYDFFGATQLSGTGTITGRYGLYVADVGFAGGVVVNNYGIYVAALSRGTTLNWGVYVAGNPSYFGGNIHVAGGSQYIYGDTTTPFIQLSNANGTTIAYGANCQLYLGGPIFFKTNNQDRMGIESDGSFWVGERVLGEATAFFHQAGTAGAKPVLLLKQSDVSEEFISFIGTSTTDASQTLVDAVDRPTPGAIAGWLKINVQDDASSGAITDGFYYVPFYAAPTA